MYGYTNLWWKFYFSNLGVKKVRILKDLFGGIPD